MASFEPRHDGEFSTEGKDYYWFADKFKDEVTGRETDDVTLKELHRPGYLILGVVDASKPGEIKYETIITPYEDWEQIQTILEQDWGSDGSRPYSFEI